jgi:polyferredoxin
MTEMSTDVLRWPVIGTLLRWRHARTTFQIVLLVAAAVVVLHGLFGPQVAPANLSTVLTWVHYRGLLVIALLAAGNLFCTGCPFVLVRDAGRRLHVPTRRWPNWLRTKWLAIALFVAVLFTYELFDLWALPGGTAYLVLTYFAAALTVDLVFTGASFCKYVCPIGQFNFIASTLSPLELGVRQPAVCSSCRTCDCLKGRPAEVAAPHVRPQRGCELQLFLPSKIGNIDCTFCLDCVQACPHDNVGLRVRLPGAELADARRRSGVGRLTERGDLAALATVFAFAGLLNAFGMIGPAYLVQRWLGGLLGTTSEFALLAAVFAIGLIAVPVLVIGAASSLTHTLVGEPGRSLRQTAMRYAYALVPFGFGVWLAHYAFHLLTGALTIVPVVQSALLEVAGRPVLGMPRWLWVGLQPGTAFPVQLGFIVLGACGSLALAYNISERDHPSRAGAATMPWALAIVALTSAAIWILAQPMEMRGTIFAG